jgi:cell shape-determining protein MreC
VFPEGYPVATITEVHRDAIQPLAQVRAQPLAHLDTDSEVMLVWFRAGHPAAPVAGAGSGDLKSGNPAMQPQPAPPPKPAPPKSADNQPPAARGEE